MSLFGSPVFIDLHNLRMGCFQDTWTENGMRCIKFLPFNKFGLFGGEYVTIRNIIDSPNVLVDFYQREHVPGAYTHYKVLLSAEHGQSYFLKNYLGSRLPELIKSQQETQFRASIAESVAKTRERQMTRGTETVLGEFKRQMKLLEEARKSEEELRRRRRMGVDEYGRGI